MTTLAEQGRPEPPLAGDDTATLLGSLERQRATLAASLPETCRSRPVPFVGKT